MTKEFILIWLNNNRHCCQSYWLYLIITNDFQHLKYHHTVFRSVDTQLSSVLRSLNKYNVYMLKPCAFSPLFFSACIETSPIGVHMQKKNNIINSFKKLLSRFRGKQSIKMYITVYKDK